MTMDHEIDEDPQKYRDEWFNFEMPETKEFQLPNVSNTLMYYWLRRSNKSREIDHHQPIQHSDPETDNAAMQERQLKTPSDGSCSSMISKETLVKEQEVEDDDDDDQVEFIMSSQQLSPEDRKVLSCCLRKLTMQSLLSKSDHEGCACEVAVSTGNALLGGQMSSQPKKRKLEVVENEGGLLVFKSDEGVEDDPQKGYQNGSNQPPNDYFLASAEESTAAEDKIEEVSKYS